MPDDRRSFIRRFGVTLGSLIVSGSLPGCGPKRDEALPTAERQVGRRNGASSGPHGPQWQQLRQCWLNLNDTQGIRKAVNENYLEFEEQLKQQRDIGQTGEKVRDPLTMTKDELAKEHQAVLDTLVAKGELKEPIAGQMQLAFEEAAYHVTRSMATCYLGLPIEHAPRQDLLKQADALRKIAGDLDPATVATAQAAIAQDVAFFEIFRTGHYDYLPLGEKYRASGFKPSPEALEAARLLTRLFLETPD